MWELVFSDEITEWLDTISPEDLEQVVSAFDILEREGPALGRPLVDLIKGSALSNLKELRPGSSKRTEIRILFIFDPSRRAILLTGENKAGNWNKWYVKAIKRAEDIYEIYQREQKQKTPKRKSK